MLVEIHNQGVQEYKNLRLRRPSRHRIEERLDQDFGVFGWTLMAANTSREGVIIEWPLFHLFHDARDVIITSQNDVRGMNDENDVQTLVDVLKR